jgi:Asparagine synthase
MGFSVPLARWLRGPLRNWAEERIEDSELFENGLLDQNEVRSLFHLHLSGARDAHPLLWSILMYLQFLGTAGETSRASLGFPAAAAIDFSSTSAAVSTGQ